MPLVDGQFTDLVLPSAKHARVIYDNTGYHDATGVWHPWRVRCMYGGRHGGKDWSFAAAAIERAVRVSTRFLCTREVQLTIADSSLQLLKDTINRLGYADYFDVTNKNITCKINDSSFVFRGLNDNVSRDVKSMEGIDVVILGEAENLQQQSWVDLDPTIRKKDSEIWIMFNTRLDTDFIYQMCVANPPPNAIVEKVNYTDLPRKMVSDVIREQAERMERENPSLYRNVWLGEPMTTGLFFGEFGRHNSETPFVISDEDGNDNLFGSLDHGITHNTAFTLYWLHKGHIHAIFTYCNNGGTTRSHAEAIVEAIEGCRLSRYWFPTEVFYDYAMETKHKLNEQMYRSDLDEYLEVFKSRPGGIKTRFTPANKRKTDGCHAMRQVFSVGNGEPIFRYFDGLNDALVESIKKCETDVVNPEAYAKQDGDDAADSLRYGIMGVLARSAAMNNRKNNEADAAVEMPRPLELGRQYGGLS
jgi:hypothetical protein